MSYKLFSLKQGDDHDLSQWNSRTLEGELNGFENRTLSTLFEKYLTGKKFRILEGGCGYGAWCDWFEIRGHDIIGIEYNQTIIDTAKKFNPTVSVELGNILDLKYPDSSFDAYISLGVIEHFENGPQPALKEALRILKPDGYAIITTPYLNPLRQLFSHPIRSIFFFFARLIGKKTYFWEYRFTENELVGYIKDAGFEIVEVSFDDYPKNESRRHIGLWADWFLLRKNDGDIWELNTLGKSILALFKLFPSKWYCSGLAVIAKAKK